MNIFPMLVYISPGPHQCPGGTFAYKQVVDSEALLQAAKDGYYPTIQLALEKPGDFSWHDYSVEQGWGSESGESSGPTREELEEKAKELGIAFNKNTKDETLLKKITAALDVED